MVDGPRMDKSVVTIASLHDNPDDREYWLGKRPSERLEGVELMRQIVYGYDPSTARLQRLLEVARLARS